LAPEHHCGSDSGGADAHAGGYTEPAFACLSSSEDQGFVAFTGLEHRLQILEDAVIVGHFDFSSLNWLRIVPKLFMVEDVRQLPHVDGLGADRTHVEVIGLG
jgi:hypothetical protein